jgi:hypothetical protein
MKFIKVIKSFALICLLASFVMACNTDTRQGASRDFEEFSTWVDENTERAETATEEEWNEMQAEYHRRSLQMEKRSGDWDDKTKGEWDALKERWYETEGKAETRFRANEVGMEVDNN